jgi:hypothetical protein
MSTLFATFVWLMVVYGITQIVADAGITRPLKDRMLTLPVLSFVARMMDCFLCASVWVSFFVSLSVWSPTATVFESDAQFFLDGMFGSACLWFLRGIESLLHD